MPPRREVPPVLAGRRPSLVRSFERDYAEAVGLERAAGLGRRVGPVQSIGPSYAAVGWLMRYDRDARRRRERKQRRKEAQRGAE